MASKTYMDLMIEVKQSLGIALDQQIALSHLDDAFRWFWDRHPWETTIGEMAPFYLVPGWSVYVSPLVEIPSDFRDLYTASLVSISSGGGQQSHPLEIIQNIEVSNQYGRPTAIGYNRLHSAFLTDLIPDTTLGYYYVRPHYKKDYPVDLTASNAANTLFPIKRHEGLFKLILGWFVRGKLKEDYGRIQQELLFAFENENPGKQDQAQPGQGLFSNLGR